MGNINVNSNDIIIGDEESGWLFHLLEFCDEITRVNISLLSKRYHNILATDASFLWRLRRLHVEEGVYFPPKVCMIRNKSWKSIYMKFKRYRGLWTCDGDKKYKTGGRILNHMDTFHEELSNSNNGKGNSNILQDPEKFYVNVSVRLKPQFEEKKYTMQGRQQSRMMLPLHQRLELIRINNKFNSNTQALGVLKDQGEWFKDKWDKVENEAFDKSCIDDSKNLDIVEPQTNYTKLKCGINSVDCNKNNIFVVDSTKGLRKFDFDSVLSDTIEQDDVYSETVAELVCEFMNGVNVTSIVYGMTGSGKTYTMFGPSTPWKGRRRTSISRKKKVDGIVPRACREIFEAIEYRHSALNLDIRASVSVSYIEIYGNEISDLLKKGSLCGHNKASSQRFVLHGETTEVPVNDMGDVAQLLSIGEKHKRKAATAMNQHSSRAHSIFIVTLKQFCTTTGVERTSKLFMADLGGCEKTKKSDIVSGSSNHWKVYKDQLNQRDLAVHDDAGNEEDNDDRPNQVGIRMDDDDDDDDDDDMAGETVFHPNEYSTGFVKSNRMREAVHINLGLMALKSCVRALNAGDSYVPYAHSKLTMMLSAGLGRGEDNCQTSIIICVSQEEEHASETISALSFGQACRNVDLTSSTISPNSDSGGAVKALMMKIDTDIASCEAAIRKKERWEVREERRVDTLAESGTLEEGRNGIEITKTTVLVGAEEERKQLNELMRQKMELNGILLMDDENYYNHNKNDDGDKKKMMYGGEIGFGMAHTYGFGKQYCRNTTNQENNNNVEDNYRFEEKVQKADVPLAVKRKGGESGWKTGQDLEVDSKKLSDHAKKVNRNKLVYSGISA